MNGLFAAIGLVFLTIFGLFFIMSAGANGSEERTDTGTFPNPAVLPPIIDGKQDVFLRATAKGIYSPAYLAVKKGVPVRIHYSADEYAGCGREVIFPEYKIRKLAPSNGEVLIEFTPTKLGKFPFHCSMKMFNGVIEVVA